jgi:hypothetical protein
VAPRGSDDVPCGDGPVERMCSRLNWESGVGGGVPSRGSRCNFQGSSGDITRIFNAFYQRAPTTPILHPSMFTLRSDLRRFVADPVVTDLDSKWVTNNKVNFCTLDRYLTHGS